MERKLFNLSILGCGYASEENHYSDEYQPEKSESHIRPKRFIPYIPFTTLSPY